MNMILCYWLTMADEFCIFREKNWLRFQGCNMM